MIAVITSFFNFGGFVRPQFNMQMFLRFMKSAGVPVYGVEACVGASVTAGMTNWKQVRLSGAKQVVWQKEALLNLAEKMVPDKYDIILWIDADVWFENPDWVGQTEDAIDDHDVVQLFDKCVRTAENGKSEFTNTSIAKAGKLDESWKAHTGFAWGMWRENWVKGNGLYPFAISGGCDTVMALHWMGLPTWEHVEKHRGSNPLPWVRWSVNYERSGVGCTPGTLYHMWHGNRVHRNYYNRCRDLAHLDHEKDLKIGKNGLVEWTDHAPKETVKLVLDGFKRRAEDGAV